MKPCTQCGAVKPLDEFYRRSARPNAYRAACKECSKARTREWAAANAERHGERTRRWRDANPLRTRQQDALRNARVHLHRTIRRAEEMP